MNAETQAPGTSNGKNAWLIIPVFEDWAALNLLLSAIGGLSTDWRFDVLVVNDHPLPPPDGWFAPGAAGTLQSVRVLSLRRNVGHQRAIALGFCHWLRQGYSGQVAVLDADGEDQPRDVLRLLDEAEAQGRVRVVFAARQKRSENLVFRTGYHLYRHVHYLLTGMHVRFGNFSTLSKPHVQALVYQSDLWNHYANAVLRSRLPYASIPTSRGHRLAGRSRMNLGGWVAHGLSALAMFSDVAGTRALLAGAAGLVCSFLLVLVSAVWAAAFGSGAAQWSVLAGLVLFAIFLQATAATLLFLFMVLGNRTAATFIPARDGAVLIGDEKTIWSRAEFPVPAP